MSAAAPEIQPLATDPAVPRWVSAVVFGALAFLLLKGVAEQRAIDPDIWHEMALIREVQHNGELPRRNVFSFTPSVDPVVHHEWGTGVVLYWVSTHLGLGGLAALRYLLAGATVALCLWCSLRQGAGAAVCGPLAIVGLFFCRVAYSPVRAQAFTLLGCAVLLWCLELDRRGRRAWLVPWLVVYVLWLNLHAGFVVGGILIAAHAIEQTWRRAAIRHVWGLALAMLFATLLNPYGWDYVTYLWHGLLMNRPDIREWDPIWQGQWSLIGLYGLSLFILLYVTWHRGFAALPGLAIVALTAYAGFRHQRHLSLYAVAWLASVPAFVQCTPLGRRFERLASGRPVIVGGMWLGLGGLAAAAWMVGGPWKIIVPANRGAHVFNYPAGAAAYLQEAGFTGDLMTHFNDGAFITWKLYPDVRVGLDGRYEVAYLPQVATDNDDLYNARGAWREILQRYPSDAVLIPTQVPLAKHMSPSARWKRVYRDDGHEIYARANLGLPVVDHRGRRFEVDFP